MKNNKTKPIKKLMIFIIITVMIVSLFAIPTFAVVNNVDWDDVVGTLPAIDIQVDGYAPVNTVGYYCIQIDGDDLNAMSSALAGEFGVNYNFPLFGNVANNNNVYYNGYVRVHMLTGDVYTYKNARTGDNDDTYVTFRTRAGDSSFECPIDDNYVPYEPYQIELIELIIPEYPIGNGLGNAQADYFWNNVVYTVYQYSNATPDPDPDPDPDPPTDPDTPTDANGIFDVWNALTEWIIEGLKSITNAFYYEDKLTILGVLCIVPVGIGVAFLLISIIQKMLRLRG